MNRVDKIKFCCACADVFEHQDEDWESLSDEILDKYVNWYNFLCDYTWDK